MEGMRIACFVVGATMAVFTRFSVEDTNFFDLCFGCFYYVVVGALCILPWALP